MGSNLLIDTKNIEKSFNGKKVLKDISINVPKQSCYSLLGINGAGKSTLMKIITGIIVKYTGRVNYNGVPFKREFLRNIGSLIEGPSFYDNLTAIENLKIICLQENINFSRIPKVLDDVGLASSNRDKAKNYSLGMKQRLGLAIALIKEPQLLVLDEPFNGLDPYGVEEIKSFLKHLIKSGRTIIISSHILSELENITDKVGIIHHGQIVYEQEFSSIDDLKQIFFNYTKT
ncbi:MAG: ATP-binding cassette domain-containing protein [Neisseriaceae bacterium]|nr:MAG: ATP-binding cassette domain-containing protein [Neisseriaceae bacterium]